MNQSKNWFICTVQYCRTSYIFWPVVFSLIFILWTLKMVNRLGPQPRENSREVKTGFRQRDLDQTNEQQSHLKSSESVRCMHGEVNPIQIGLKLLFTLQQKWNIISVFTAEIIYISPGILLNTSHRVRLLVVLSWPSWPFLLENSAYKQEKSLCPAKVQTRKIQNNTKTWLKVLKNF